MVYQDLQKDLRVSMIHLVAHSSTSISAALGTAKQINWRINLKCDCCNSDGAISAGMLAKL